MARIQVEVMETTEDGQRRIHLDLTGAAEDFLFADLLAKRKKIESITTVLKQAALEAIKAYLESAEEVISGVNPEQKKEAPATTESTSKRGRKSKESASEDEIQPAQMTTKTVNGSIPATAFSGD
jgi:hypothetical protein